MGPKGEVPCRLEGLEVLIGLEESAPRAECVQGAQQQQAGHDEKWRYGEPMLRMKLAGLMSGHYSRGLVDHECLLLAVCTRVVGCCSRHDMQPLS